MKNEILREVWKNRDKFAKRCHYNLNLMAEALKKVEHKIHNPIINGTKKRPAKHHSTI